MRVFLTALLSLLVCASACHALQAPPELEAPLQLMNNGQLLEACHAFSTYRESHAEDPLANLLLALCKWKTMWLSAYTDEDRKDLITLLETTEGVCSEKDDNDCLFFRAATSAIRAQVLATENEWWSTAQESKKLKSRAQTLVERAPDYYDGYYLLGSFNYFADVLPGYIKFVRHLMFLPGGNRRAGMEQLTLAYQKSGIASVEAGRTLALINTYYEKRFDVGLQLCDTLLGLYPDNFEIALYKGVNLYFLGNFEQAETWFQIVRQKIEAYSTKHITSDTDPVVPVYRPMVRELRYWIARCLIQQNKDLEAKEILKELAVPEIHRPYWIERAVQLSLAQLAYRAGKTAEAEWRIAKVLRWSDTKNSQNKARTLKKKKNKIDPYDLDFL